MHKAEPFNDVKKGDTVVLNPFFDWIGNSQNFKTLLDITVTGPDLVKDKGKTTIVADTNISHAIIKVFGVWCSRAMLLVKGVDYVE